MFSKISTPPIHIYFYRSRASLGLKALPAALIAIVLFSGCYQYWQLSSQISQKKAWLNQKNEEITPARAEPKLSTQETQSVEKALNEINFPWAQPFQIIEASHDEKISLLEVHHEPSKQDIRITAQTADIANMFSYIKKIKNTPHVRRVILNSQESFEDETHPIMFTLTVSWI